MVNHDPTLDRTAGRPGRIAQMDWDELRHVDIGDGQNMLLLDELLEMLGDNPHHLYIETKHPSGQGDVLEEQLVLRLRYAGLLDDPRIHMISFSHKAIRRMQSLPLRWTVSTCGVTGNAISQISFCLVRRGWECHCCVQKCVPMTLGRSTCPLICGPWIDPTI